MRSLNFSIDLILHMYEALHQSALGIKVLTEEVNSLYGTNIKDIIFSLNIHWMEL
jgi:hypothetical protein